MNSQFYDNDSWTKKALFGVMGVLVFSFAFADSSKSDEFVLPDSPRPMFLSWKKPKTTFKDIGGVISYLKASNTGSGDWFGYSLSLSGDGNTLAVGAIREDSNAGGIDGDQKNNEALGSGAVYVFTRDKGGHWEQQAYLKASNTGREDFFGQSLSLSDDGNTLAVGAYGEDSNASGIDGDQENNEAERSGAVYVFTRDNEGHWEQQAYLKASNTERRDWFGHSLSLSGDGRTLAVGAYGEDSNASGIDSHQRNNEARSSGAVYVFRDKGGQWEQQAYLKASNAESTDWFGRSLGLSDDGRTLAVGAYGEDSNASGIDGNQRNNEAWDSGAVYVFTRNKEGEWEQQAYLKASNTEDLNYFGVSLGLSDDGRTLAVGAYGEDSNASGIDGNQRNNEAESSGAVYVFTRNKEGEWEQQTYLKASNPGRWDYFGYSLGLSDDGGTLAVGATGEASNARGIDGHQENNEVQESGAVYVFTRDKGGQWEQQAYLKASNTEKWDWFGYSLGLSGDGGTLAVGAIREDSNARGIDGDQGNNEAENSGAVYIYRVSEQN